MYKLSSSKEAFAGHARDKHNPQIGSSVITYDKYKQSKVFSENFQILAGEASNTVSEKECNGNLDQYIILM